MNPNARRWWAIRIEITDEAREAVINFLFELGSVGCVDYEDELIAYFPGERDLDLLQFDVAAYLSALDELEVTDGRLEFLVEQVVDRDWNAAWKKGLRPIHVSARLVVKPTWTPYSPGENEIVLEIDPKQAFGTGTHATTQLCLRAVERLIQGGEEVLDIGTGTGVLAIAAIKLGARKALAVDVDPVALDTARENAVINRVDDRIDLHQGRLETLPPRAFELVVANLNRREIETDVLPHLQQFVAPASHAVLSGILRQEAEALLGEVKKCGFCLKAMETHDEWVALLLQPAGE